MTSPPADETRPIEGKPLSSAQTVVFRDTLWFWVRLGFISFGGPAGQIAIMHRELVEQKKWVREDDFLRALNFCMVLPGPEAQQLATYIGWRFNRTWGAIWAGAWFVIPSFFVLLLLTWMAVAQADVKPIGGILYGIQPVALAIVAEAVIRVGRRVAPRRALLVLPAAAFIAIFFVGVPFPLIILAAAIIGVVLVRIRPEIFGPGMTPRDDGPAIPGADAPEQPVYPPLSRGLKMAVIFIVLWIVPVAVLVGVFGPNSLFVEEALFFTQTAFLTFGGAYSVLTYVADVAVNTHGWLSASEMVQGLGLAESTPGPLIMVNQYVGFFGGYRSGEEMSPVLAGTMGALTVTYVTFLPSFFFILAGAPYVEALARNRTVQAALTCVTAAVLGVILNLAVFFGQNVLYPEDSLDFFALTLALVAFGILQRFRVQVYAIVIMGAAAGAVRELLFL